MTRWVAVLTIGLMLITGCAALRVPPSSALPPPSALPCCWQSQERVRITAGSEEHTFLAALSVSPAGLTVVVLDELGRRLLTLVHDGGRPQTLEAPPGWPEHLSQSLLLALYLHHLTPQQWQHSSRHWSAVEVGSSRILHYRGQERVRLHYAAISATVPVEPFAHPRRVDFPGHDLQINVVTVSKDELGEQRDMEAEQGAELENTP